jgi:hypothetical protein
MNKLVNIEALDSFIKEAREVERLHGNHGRKVLRFIERHRTEDGTMRFAFSMREGSSLLTAALMAQAVNKAIADETYFSYPGVSVHLEVLGLAGRMFGIRVEVPNVPEFMKDRQNLVRTIEMKLSTIQRVVQLHFPESRTEELLEGQFFRNVLREYSVVQDTEATRQVLRAQLHQLVSGDFSSYGKMYLAVISLAMALNPEVAVADARYNEETDAQFEAIYADARGDDLHPLKKFELSA